VTTTDSYILYGHRTSGHSYKVALALALAGRSFEYRDVDLRPPRAERRADWQVNSRFGEIPVLVEGGRPLSQSDAILLRLAEADPELAGGADRHALSEWLFWEANRIGFSLPNLRVTVRAEGLDTPIARWLHGRFTTDLDRLELELTDRPFLAGSRMSVVDLACAAYLLFEDNPVAIAPWPRVCAWLGRLRGLSGWRPPHELMPPVGALASED
jgi:glutathione S-transferase